MSEQTERDDGGAPELHWRALFTLLGRAHTWDLLYEMALAREPPVRFNELQDALDVPPNTLSRRLDELEQAGFVDRRSYDEIPPRVEYEPTERLYDLGPACRELQSWLEEHGGEDLHDVVDV